MSDGCRLFQSPDAFITASVENLSVGLGCSSDAWVFFLLVLALPLREILFGWFPWTLFRSPARQIYLLNFSLVVFLGVFLDHMMRSRWRFKNVSPIFIVAVLITLHVVDLYKHSHAFMSSGADRTCLDAAN